MVRYLPIFLGIVLIVGLTIPQINMTDRLSGTNVSAEQRAELLNKVPAKIGDWIGEDKETDEKVRETAGAIGAVSRTYRNSRTGEVVDLWLIVGHARDVSAHTPDICYPASGFSAKATENSLYPIPFTEGTATTMPFWTNTFLKEDITGQRLVRVFWSWHNPDTQSTEGRVAWSASKNPRLEFGNARALYKMYFTSVMKDPKETAESSAAVRFARDFLPEVNKALEEVYHTAPGGDATIKPAAEANVAAPKADETKPAETAAPAASAKSETAEPVSTKDGTFGPYGTNPGETPPAAEKDLFGTSSPSAAAPADKAGP
jgi:uncharacterized protein DUF3485